VRPDSVVKFGTSSTSFCFAFVLLMLCSAQQVSARSYFRRLCFDQIACNNDPSYTLSAAIKP
jgi:hypothetical protein